MSRDLEAGLVGEITAPALAPVLLAEFLFDAGSVRLWNGLGNLTALGNTYLGAGTLLALSQYEETSKLEAKGITFTLSGLSSSIISTALQEPYQGRECSLYIGALDSAGVLVSAPYRLFQGYMDVMEISESGETCSVSVSAESRMIIINRTKERRYTAEDQKAEFAGDLGFDFVTAMQDREIIWKGKAK